MSKSQNDVLTRIGVAFARLFKRMHATENKLDAQALQIEKLVCDNHFLIERVEAQGHVIAALTLQYANSKEELDALMTQLEAAADEDDANND